MTRRRSIALTLFVAITLTALGVVSVAAGLFRLSLGKGFSDYVAHVELTRLSRVEEVATARYQAEGGWGFVQSPRDILPAPPGGLPPGGPPGAPGSRPPPPGGDRLDIGPRVALFDTAGNRIIGPPEAEHRPRRAIHNGDGGPVIGYLALAPVRDNGDGLTEQFLEAQTRNLAWIAAVAVLASALAAWLLARHIRKPISALADGARRLASGQLDARVQLHRRDELGELADDFNQMAQRLERFEQSRRQWVADTSHELRTPLTVLRAHTQAMRDGVMPLNERGLEVIDGAVAELDTLVSDLYQLARADVGTQDYQFEPVMLDVLFEEVERRFNEPMRRAGLQLQVFPMPNVLVNGDPTRLQQLLGNLMVNASRYTNGPGVVRLTTLVKGPVVEIIVDDSPPGVPDAALTQLFDRFFRVDASRSRKGGGAGLGLAICLSIVEAHQGRIQAQHSPLGGLRVVITLPLLQIKRNKP
ncbi:MAG: HAMP domain-containing protein [Burkholderiales bacterium]|nr:HAMP domain-containing protein [Burkholderiales bacterium]